MIDVQYFITLIPTIFVELFMMMLVTFLIGYTGAIITNRSKTNKLKKKHSEEKESLNSIIIELQKKLEHKEELNKNPETHLRKDRMNQDFEQLKIHKRAFSKDVINNKLPNKKETLLDYDRIGSASKTNKNELQLISGIGPFTEIKLNELGIYTFKQISNFNDEDINTVTQLIKFFPDRIKNDKWVEKAKNLCIQLENKTSEIEASNTISKKEITS